MVALNLFRYEEVFMASRTANSILWAMQWIAITGLPMFGWSCLITPLLLAIITSLPSKVHSTSFSFSSSYLEDRTQFVSVNKLNSLNHTFPFHSCVSRARASHASILSPLVFSYGVCQLETMGFFTLMKGSARNVCTFFNVQWHSKEFSIHFFLSKMVFSKGLFWTPCYSPYMLVRWRIFSKYMALMLWSMLMTHSYITW